MNVSASVLQHVKDEADAQERRGAYADAIVSYRSLLTSVSHADEAQTRCKLASCLVQIGEHKQVRRSRYSTQMLWLFGRCIGNTFSYHGPCALSGVCCRGGVHATNLLKSKPGINVC